MKQISNSTIKRGIVVTAALLAILLTLAYFKSPKPVIDDPGEHTLSVLVNNESAQRLTIKQCMDEACSKFAENHSLNPGQSVLVGGTNNDVDQPWIELDSSGKKIGCLNLNFPGKDVRNEQQVDLSKTQPCK
jgi:hypothetical protein